MGLPQGASCYNQTKVHTRYERRRVMTELNLKTRYGTLMTIILSDKSGELLAELGNKLDAKDTKRELFMVIYSIAEMTATMLKNKEYNDDLRHPFISDDLFNGMNVISDFYNFLDNLEYKNEM